MPPLKPATRISTVTAPIAVALTAIRDALERQAPRDLAGKRDNPLAELLGKADIGWTLTRGPFSVAGAPRRSPSPPRSTARCASPARSPTRPATSAARSRQPARPVDVGRDRACRTSPARPSISAPTCAAPSRSRRARSSTPTGASIRTSTPRSRWATARCRSPASSSTSPTRSSRCSSAPSTSRRRALAAPHPQRSRARARGAARMGEDVPLDLAQGRGRPMRPICGSRCARPAPSRRSRGSTRTPSR